MGFTERLATSSCPLGHAEAVTSSATALACLIWSNMTNCAFSLTAAHNLVETEERCKETMNGQADG